MLIILHADANEQDVEKVAAKLESLSITAYPARSHGRQVICLDKSLSLDLQTRLHDSCPAIEKVLDIKTAYKLASSAYKAEPTVVEVGQVPSQVRVGANEFIVIAGPCTIESEEQLMKTAAAVKQAGANILRGGAFKPRTSPYSFQGMGVEGLKLLQRASQLYNIPTVTEVMEPAYVSAVAEYADILQIGARNMQNFPLLREAGLAGKPVLLKRGPSATLDEWLMAAEYILATGNDQVILCERGIKSFDPSTRNCLDLGGVAALQEKTHLPIIVDPSHATGKRSLVPPLALAAAALGAGGIMVECHPHPEQALCDGAQSITPPQLVEIIKGVHSVTAAIREAYEPEASEVAA
ncbi:MAG TPA: 3-deoxy-7-phosphoheptulonate synthase [Chloroflexia bacterium]|nr:3-deoxy-7-phosphoheptulonate synthase [Chloroflexia bacterium]